MTDGAPRRRVLTDSLEERIDLAGAGRVREDAIEETEPARRRAVPRDGVRASASADEDADAAGDDAMDVESEDDDDEFGVRRTARGASGRKRRAIEVEDEDEE